MYILQNLHGRHGFHFLIFWRQIYSLALSVIPKGTKSQILDPRYDNVSVPYNLILYFRSENLRLDVDYLERWLH